MVVVEKGEALLVALLDVELECAAVARHKLDHFVDDCFEFAARLNNRD